MLIVFGALVALSISASVVSATQMAARMSVSDHMTMAAMYKGVFKAVAEDCCVGQMQAKPCDTICAGPAVFSPSEPLQIAAVSLPARPLALTLHTLVESKVPPEPFPPRTA